MSRSVYRRSMFTKKFDRYLGNILRLKICISHRMVGLYSLYGQKATMGYVLYLFMSFQQSLQYVIMLPVQPLVHLSWATTSPSGKVYFTQFQSNINQFSRTVCCNNSHISGNIEALFIFFKNK